MSRPRIDLDGVTLHDPDGPAMPIAVFRYRTGTGLTLLMPESGDFTVSWGDVEHAGLDLTTGEVKVVFTERYAASANWLRGARSLVGLWTDRYTMGVASA